MKNKLTYVRLGILLILIISSSNVFSQNALLWKISDADNRNSYLYGTIHLKDERVFAYADTVIGCMKMCDKVVLELDLNPMNLLQYSNMLFLTGDSTLKDFFNGKDYDTIVNTVEKTTGMQFSFFERFKPVALLSVVMENILPGDMETTLDEFFYKKGIQMHKEIVGLETFDEQFKILESIPMESVIDFLKHPEKTISDLDPMICDYLNTKLNELLRLMQEDETMANLKKEFLDERNIKMAAKIDSLFKNNTLTIAVGAGHLPGEKGLINLLKKKGYKLTPIVLEVPADMKCD